MTFELCSLLRKCIFLLFIVLVYPGSLSAQQGKVVDRIIELGKTDNRTMHHLDVISNRFGGRLVCLWAGEEIWHTENDLYTKSIPEYQEHTSVVTAVVVFCVANLDHLLSRKGLYAESEEKK